MIFAKIDNRLIIIVIKNQCPFCGKSLRVVPINSEEYCPHCGCKIEQEHKKIQIWWWGAFHEKEYIKDYRCDNVNYSYCIYNVCIEPSRKEFPWNNTITWLLYNVYFLVTVVLLIAPKMKKWGTSSL